MPYITPDRDTLLKLRPIDYQALNEPTVRAAETRDRPKLDDQQQPNKLGVISAKRAENGHVKVLLGGPLTIGGQQVDRCYIWPLHWGADLDAVLNRAAEKQHSEAIASLSTPPPNVFRSIVKEPDGTAVSAVLNIAYKSQTDNTKNPSGSCNVTMLETCLNYFGLSAGTADTQGEDVLYQEMQAQGLERHSPIDLQTIAEQHGMIDRYTSRAAIADIKQSILLGRPVGIHGYFTGSGHIVTCVGFDSSGLIFHDSYGEWTADGYLRNDDPNPQRGAYIRYSYGLVQEKCLPDGGCWAHFFDRAGRSSTPPPTPSASAPAKTDAIAKAVRAMAHPDLPEQEIIDLIKACGEWLPKFGITTRARIVHFFAQCSHESMGFYWLEEQGDDAYFTENYEGRDDLGNTQPGDGAKFSGHGLIQVTGRANHANVAAKTGIDCVNNPKLLTIYPGALVGALVWWQDNGMNALCDAGLDDADVTAVTKRINGGTNGLNDRLNRTDKLKLIIL